jgi:tetratricopeptide (TPR) repeat protein
MFRKLVLIAVVVLSYLPIVPTVHAQTYDCPDISSLAESASTLDEQTQQIEHNPTNAYAYYERANTYGELARYQDAVADLNHAIDLDPQFALAYGSRGVYTYYLYRDYQQALQDMNRAIELDNNDYELARLLIMRSILSGAGGDRQASEEDNRRAIALDATVLEEHVELGNLYLLAYEYDQAVREYTQVLDADPDSAYAYLRRGVARFYLNMYEQSLADLEDAVRYDRSNPMIHTWLGFVYFVIGRYGAALAPLNCAIELGSNEAYIFRGAVYGAQGEYGLASMDLERAVELNPEDPEAYYYRGILYLMTQAYELAIPDFNRTLELNPEYMDAYQARWYSFERLGNFRMLYRITPR